MESTGERHDISWDILGRTQTIQQVLRYVASTARFNESHGDVAPRAHEKENNDEETMEGVAWG